MSKDSATIYGITYPVLNLDSMSREELLAVAKDCNHHRGQQAYSSWTATAMSYRLEGNIQSALDCERLAQDIYDDLPKELQW